MKVMRFWITLYAMASSDDVSKEELRRVMSSLGKKGGPVGGKKRWEGMTPEERSAAMREIAAKGTQARWGTKPKTAATKKAVKKTAKPKATKK